MLISLHIRDLAVIDAAELELAAGFTVLTGETGAGKSILVDALALTLGDRADSQAVRTGAARLDVTAGFSLEDCLPARAWLADQQLDEDGTCTLRRVVGADGRSRAWVNGRPVPLQALKALGSLLVDICGQQAYQALARRAAQRELLDALAGTTELVQQVRAAHGAWQAARQARDQQWDREQSRDDRQRLLEFQVAELAALGPAAGEYEELEQEHRRHAHRIRLADGLGAALNRLEEDDGAVAGALRVVRRSLAQLVDADPALAAGIDLLAEADIQLREAADLCRRRLHALEQDPERARAVAERLEAMQELARKHRLAPPELPALHDRLAAELAGCLAAGETLAGLERTLAGREVELRDLTARLSAARGQAAGPLARQVTANMAALGMAGGTFAVRLTPLPGGNVGPTGADEVEFLVSTNPGQPPGPIGRIASGGELSRLNLAIRVVATAAGGAPTLVFDEVDAGVGGAVAEIVGQQLRALSQDWQVLCITHLAQVATQADHQIKVLKQEAAGRTTVTVRELSPPERVEETARMLGGLRITERTRAHAREMLTAGARAAPPKRRA